jgi:hypothetical protein
VQNDLNMKGTIAASLYFCVFTSCIIKIRLSLPSPLPNPLILAFSLSFRHLQRKSGLTCDVSRTTTRTIPIPRGGRGGGGGRGWEGILTIQCRRYYSTQQNLCNFSLQMNPASKGGHEVFFSTQIRKFLGSFRNRNANF